MKINRTNAMQLWYDYYGDVEFANDFHGNIMYRFAYGDPNYYFVDNGEKIYCGWNIHHILPKAHGGTNSYDNLICTNILTNEAAADKTTYWIDDSRYQVKKIPSSHAYKIVGI